MEARDQARELTHAVGDIYAAADQRRQPLSCRHAPHDHQVVAGAAVGPLNVGNTKVDVRRQPSVQLNFSPAGCLRASRVEKSRKPMATGFFSL